MACWVTAMICGCEPASCYCARKLIHRISPESTNVSSPAKSHTWCFAIRYCGSRQLPPGPFLTGGLALLPLAPISAVTEAELPGIIKEMSQRLSGRAHGGRHPWYGRRRTFCSVCVTRRCWQHNYFEESYP